MSTRLRLALVLVVDASLGGPTLTPSGGARRARSPTSPTRSTCVRLARWWDTSRAPRATTATRASAARPPTCSAPSTPTATRHLSATSQTSCDGEVWLSVVNAGPRARPICALDGWPFATRLRLAIPTVQSGRYLSPWSGLSLPGSAREGFAASRGDGTERSVGRAAVVRSRRTHHSHRLSRQNWKASQSRCWVQERTFVPPPPSAATSLLLLLFLILLCLYQRCHLAVRLALDFIARLRRDAPARQTRPERRSWPRKWEGTTSSSKRPLTAAESSAGGAVPPRSRSRGRTRWCARARRDAE